MVINLDEDEKVLCDFLKVKQDNEGIARYSPDEFGEELNMPASEVDEVLHRLYTRGVLIYVTRINKETGETLKIVQIIQEEN